jgi:competence protein ComEC
VLLPLVWFFFQQLNFIDIGVNSIAIPIISFVVVPSLLLACLFQTITPLAHALLWLAEHVLFYLWQLLSYCAHLPYWGVFLPKPTWQAVALALLGMFLLLAPSAVPGRYLGLILCLPLTFWMPTPPVLGTALVEILDVGQGLSVLIQTHSHLLLYDTGPHYPDGFDAGQKVVLPAVLNTGMRKIDRLVISHGDNDHAGGAGYVLANFIVERIDTSALKAFAQFNPHPCQGAWQWDQVSFRYLTVPVAKGSNNRSCILMVSTITASLLLPGDIQRPVEQALVKQKENLKANILVAPHHGSKTSSSQAFIDAVAPNYVVFATGLNNRFHFPHRVVVERYKAKGAQLLDTAEVGAVRFTLGNDLH